MISTVGYKIALNQFRIERHFPNLKIGVNSRYTSEHTLNPEKQPYYNCAAWAIENSEAWIEFSQDEHGNFDANVNKYVQYFSSLGFAITPTVALEPDFVKIAIYVNQHNDFKHVARQLPDGKWTSKIGDWEDIEHNTIQDVGGGTYGDPTIFMRKFFF